MVYVARFATHKEMFVNMPVGMRLRAVLHGGGARGAVAAGSGRGPPAAGAHWSFEQAQAVFGPQVVETAHAISVSRTLGRSYPFYELEPPGGALRATPISVAGEA